MLSAYSKHQVFIIQTLHQDEVKVPFNGSGTFTDPEDDKHKIKTYLSTKMKKIYNEALHEHSNKIAAICKRNSSFIYRGAYRTTYFRCIFNFVEGDYKRKITFLHAYTCECIANTKKVISNKKIILKRF